MVGRPKHGAGPYHGADPLSKPAAILLLLICEVGGMALWFSATAAAPGLVAEGLIQPGDTGWLTSAVQLGFAIGAGLSAWLLLADRFDPRRLFAASAALGGLANLAILAVGPDSSLALAARLMTGICMAGVYPVGMKLATSWAKGDMGLLIGLLVGALSIGSAAPHLFSALGGLDWRLVFALASISAFLAAIGILFVPIGPNIRPSPPFKPGRMLDAFKRPELRFANFGYLGHMWELYAVWGWIGLFFAASFAAWSDGAAPDWLAPAASFAMIAVGGLGAMLAGYFADRVGRTAVAMTALSVSGICCLLAGLFFAAHPAWVIALGIVWGVAVIADSAQFSASVAELADPDVTGTMLTIQTCLGFLLTLITIELVGTFADILGWQYVFWLLAPGPFFGLWAMWRLRCHPKAEKLAGGLR